MNAPFKPTRETLKLESPRRPVHDARVLTEGGTGAHIVLDGTLYILHITRQGKLILTK